MTTYRLRPVHQLVEAEQFTAEQAAYAVMYESKSANERKAEGLAEPTLPRGVAIVHGRFMLDVPGTADDVAMQIGDYVLRDAVTGDLCATPVLHPLDFDATYEALQALPKAEELDVVVYGSGEKVAELGSAVDAVESMETAPTEPPLTEPPLTRKLEGKFSATARKGK